MNLNIPLDSARKIESSDKFHVEGDAWSNLHHPRNLLRLGFVYKNKDMSVCKVDVAHIDWTTGKQRPTRRWRRAKEDINLVNADESS